MRAGLFAIIATFVCILTMYACFRYGLEQDIGINVGMMVAGLILFDALPYAMVFAGVSFLLGWSIARRGRLHATVAILLLLGCAWLLFDFHRYQHPSPIQEESTSVFWSRVPGWWFPT